jgi:hypothetical protein
LTRYSSVELQRALTEDPTFIDLDVVVTAPGDAL